MTSRVSGRFSRSRGRHSIKKQQHIPGTEPSHGAEVHDRLRGTDSPLPAIKGEWQLVLQTHDFYASPRVYFYAYARTSVMFNKDASRAPPSIIFTTRSGWPSRPQDTNATSKSRAEAWRAKDKSHQASMIASARTSSYHTAAVKDSPRFIEA